MAWNFFKSPEPPQQQPPETYSYCCRHCDVEGLTYEESNEHYRRHDKERSDHEMLKFNTIKTCHEIVNGFINKQNPTTEDIARVRVANEYLRTMLAPEKSITVNTAPHTYDGPDWPGVL